MANDRGDFTLRMGVGPTITRKIGNRLVVTPVLGSRRVSEEGELDELLAGVTRDDVLNSGRSGFGKKVGAAGAGSFDGDPYPAKRMNHYDNPNRDNLSSMPDGQYLGEDPDVDLLMQPDGDPPKEEGDFISTDDPSTRARNTDPFVNPTSIQSLDQYDQAPRDREVGQNTPLFASLDEIDGLFE